MSNIAQQEVTKIFYYPTVTLIGSKRRVNTHTRFIFNSAECSAHIQKTPPPT